MRLLDAGYSGRDVLVAVDAVVPEGARVLVVGDNGSGKSTLLATLSGLLPKRGGHLRVAGMDPHVDRRRLHAHAGHLGHGDPFYPELTGRENLDFHARLRQIPPVSVATGLTAVALLDAADRPVGTYSHGMRRRLGIAKALLGDPRLVLLDEPESGLDAEGRRRFRALLGARTDRTVILSTHHWPDWLAWADHVWVLARGGLTALALDGPEETRGARIEAALGHGGDAP